MTKPEAGDPIKRVYIGCYAGDFWLARICVASVRHWYPSIRISLIKDLCGGDFSTARLERDFEVDIAPTPRFMRNFGRLEVIFQETRERFLYLDADIVVAGRVLEAFASHNENFVVHKQPKSGYSDTALRNLYYCEAAIRDKLDPAFEPPDFVFNSGQFVGTSGILTRADFGDIIDWSCTPPRNNKPSILALNDQGPLNYLLPKLSQLGQISLGHSNFQRNGADASLAEELLGDDLTCGKPFVVHWPGTKSLCLRSFPNARILRHYESLYLKRSSLSWFFYAGMRFKEVIRSASTRFVRKGYARLPESAKRLLRRLRAGKK